MSSFGTTSRGVATRNRRGQSGVGERHRCRFWGRDRNSLWESLSDATRVPNLAGASYLEGIVMSNQKITHCGFSDESSWNEGQYRSIALVTGSVAGLKEMEGALKEVLEEHEISEFKWKDMTSSKKCHAATQMVRIAGDHAKAGNCRIDVLVWDSKDARHDVPGRDDLQNLGRMYYHLAQNVLHQKWPSNAVWMILPDEHHATDWSELEQCLDATSMKPSQPLQASFATASESGYHGRFNIVEIKPVRSQKYRLTQLADLFAGVSVFSWNNHASFRAWQIGQSLQQSLFEMKQCHASKTSRDRFPVLQQIITVCKQRKFALSMDDGGLKTPAYRRNDAINFWFYQSKGEYDKAPVKSKSRSGLW